MLKRHFRLKPCKGAILVDGQWKMPEGKFPTKGRQKAIPRRSKKRLKLDKIYSQENRWFLAKLENSSCPVAAAGLIPDANGELKPHHRAATTVHHAWRRGKYYLDQSTWIGMSWEGNCAWVENNKEEARKRGWLCDTAETRERWRASHGGLPLI